MSRYFADLKVGDELPPMEFPVTEDWVTTDTVSKDDTNPWYSEGSPFGGPVAPPTLTNADFDRFLRANGFVMSGVMPVGTDHEYFGPIMVGSTVRVTCKIAERYERKGRDYVTFEFVTTDTDGKVLMTKRDTLLQMPQIAREQSA